MKEKSAFWNEKIKRLIFGTIILPLTGGGGSPVATQSISYSGVVKCEENPLIKLQSFVVQFYVGGQLDSSAEIDSYGIFKKEDALTKISTYTFKLVRKSTGKIVDQVKFESVENRKTYTVSLDACRDAS